MKKLIPVYVRVPFLFFSVFGLLEYFIDSGDKPAFIEYPMVLVFLVVFLFLLIAIEFTFSATENMMYQLLDEEQKKVFDEAKDISITESEWYKKVMSFFVNSEPIENEGELLLDHDYDGIKELDNNLPPWWVYLFYGCIVFAAVYLVRFEVLDGDTQEMELQKEIAQAKIDVENYLKTAPDLMDESKVTQLTDAGDLAQGKEIFNTNCAACHKADGGGQIGPNLTDDYWILGGSIKNIFHTLENGGRDGKGMISWKGTLKPKEMQLVASYVMSLNGTNPKDAKESEGDLFIDNEVEKSTTKIDSTQTK
jgi:cytochrome c oxidase cbb3-type subunit 3